MKLTKGGRLDRRFKGVKEGETALYAFVASVVLCAVIIYFSYVYLFIVLPFVLLIVCYQYYSQTFNSRYTISISILLLCLYIILLGILTGQNKNIILGNYNYKEGGGYKQAETWMSDFNSNIKVINIINNTNFIEKLKKEQKALSEQEGFYQLRRGDRRYNEYKKLSSLISYAEEQYEAAIIETQDSNNDKYHYGNLRIAGSNYTATLEKIYNMNHEYFTFANDKGYLVFELELYIKGLKKILKVKMLSNGRQALYSNVWEGGFIFAYRHIFISVAISFFLSVVIFVYMKNNNIGLINKINIESPADEGDEEEAPVDEGDEEEITVNRDTGKQNTAVSFRRTIKLLIAFGCWFIVLLLMGLSEVSYGPPVIGLSFLFFIGYSIYLPITWLRTKFNKNTVDSKNQDAIS